MIQTKILCCIFLAITVCKIPLSFSDETLPKSESPQVDVGAGGDSVGKMDASLTEHDAIKPKSSDIQIPSPVTPDIGTLNEGTLNNGVKAIVPEASKSEIGEGITGLESSEVSQEGEPEISAEQQAVFFREMVARRPKWLWLNHIGQIDPEDREEHTRRLSKSFGGMLDQLKQADELDCVYTSTMAEQFLLLLDALSQPQADRAQLPLAVRQELDLIGLSKGVALSPIWRVPVDYSAYAIYQSLDAANIDRYQRAISYFANTSLYWNENETIGVTSALANRHMDVIRHLLIQANQFPSIEDSLEEFISLLKVNDRRGQSGISFDTMLAAFDGRAQKQLKAQHPKFLRKRLGKYLAGKSGDVGLIESYFYLTGQTITHQPDVMVDRVR